MCLSCLLQKIMRREYIKAQNPSTFKEQLSLIKNTPGKARVLGERQGTCSTDLAITLTSVLQPPSSAAAALGSPHLPVLVLRDYKMSQLGFFLLSY